jgi:protein-S-isoprenylcysteine O-methyltransferase Ste14
MKLKHKYFLDSHKGLNGLAIAGLMAWYHAWDNPTLWIYLALHGTYGLLWVAKSRFFGDRQWEREIGWGYGLFTWAGLSAYWVSPWLMASGRAAPAPAWYAAICISLFCFGVFLHFASDMHKHVALQLRPGVLITDGLFSIVRNPNYLGELFIYLGFTLLARHPAPLLLLGLIIVAGWVPFIRKKERSLARYAEWADYKRRTKALIPGLI